MNASTRLTLQILLPVAALVAAGTLAFLLIRFARTPEKGEPVKQVVPVETATFQAGTVPLFETAQGTLRPRVSTRLAAEVSGRVASISPGFEAGRFFLAGDVLVTIDEADYKARLASAEAGLQRARAAHALAKANAEQARSDAAALGLSDPGPLVLRLPQLEEAAADLASAEAALETARRDLERTRIRAPYDGVVETAEVDTGDFVAAGSTPLGTLLATDFAEIRLPLSRDQLRHLDLPATPEAIDRPPEEKPGVTLSTNGIERTGWIDRLEATVDPVTRLRYAVAILPDPLARAPGASGPIPFGSFIRARIEGLPLDHAYRLPRVALVNGGSIRVLREGNRLHQVPVEVVQELPGEVVIRAADLPPEIVVSLTPLQVFSEGLEVEPEGGKE